MSVLVVLHCFIAGCKPNLESKDGHERLRAVKELADQSLLARVATEDCVYDIRQEAFQRIDEQVPLATVAIKAIDVSFQRAAVERITTQSLLARIVAQVKDTEIRLAALKKVTDQAQLVRVVAESNDSDIQLVALARITNQSSLHDAIVGCTRKQVQLAALDKLSNQALLAQLVDSDVSNEIRSSALHRITDQTILRKFAEEGARDEDVRCLAVVKLSDPVTLTKLALEDESLQVRSTALRQLDDDRIVAELVDAATDPALRQRASVFQMVRNACKQIPEERRERIWFELLGIAFALTESTVRAHLGDVTNVRVEWRSLSRHYSLSTSLVVADGAIVGRDLRADGEEIAVDIVMSAMDRAISHHWETNFPESIQVSKDVLTLVGVGGQSRWIEAWVKPDDVLEKACELVPESSLVKIAIEGQRPALSRLAAERIASQQMLAKIVVEGKDVSTRLAALQKITEPEVLAAIAESDSNPKVRQLASKRLSDQQR